MAEQHSQPPHRVRAAPRAEASGDRRPYGDVFAYDLAWTNAEQGRPLSLTLPFLPGNGEHRGAHVANWFENLLPDSTEIRSRIARRFGVRSSARQLMLPVDFPEQVWTP
jgi:HipA-like protein